MSYEADIKHLRLVHYIACALALLPPYTAETHSRLFRLYKLYALVAIIFYSCLVPYFIYAKYIKRIVCIDCDYIRNTIEAIYQTIQVLSTIVTATDSTFRHGNKFYRFIKLLLNVKVKGQKQKQSSCLFSVQYPTVLLHSCMAIIFALQLYIVIKRPDTGILDGKYLYVYGVGLSTVMVYKYLSVIKRQLVFLNKKLTRGTPDFESIANARQVYYQISKVVLAFNDAFGLRIFIIYAFCFIGLLHVASLAISYIIEKGDINMVYMMCIWSSAIIVIVLSLITMSDTMGAEGRATGAICYNYLTNMPAALDVVNKNRLQCELIALINLSESFPAISAGGLFAIDYKLVLGFFGSIISYVIIIIQIKKQ